MQESPPKIVAAMAERFEILETDFHRAYWDSQIESTKQNDARRTELELELRRVKGDAEMLEAVTAALSTDVHDPLIRRQLEVLRLSLAANQMDDARRAEIVELSAAIESGFASFRPAFDGRRLTNNDIESILKTSNEERERRGAWEASKEIGASVAPRLLDLVRLRNEVALSLGYADHYRMALELQELSEEWLFDRMHELERLTEEPYRRWKEELDLAIRRRFGVARVSPWHYADPFFQQPPPEGKVDLAPVFGEASAPELAKRTFEGWGIDIGAVIESSDLYPRELKCQHAFCLDVDRSGTDVRILANVVPGEQWIQVLLHESGHAAYDVSLNSHLPYLLRRASHIFVTEAIALLSGRLVHDPDWLTRIAGIARDRVASIEFDLSAAQAAERLQFSRWGLVMTHFERDMYSDPEQDLDARWWELVSRFQLVLPPDDPPEGAWASKIHLATAPVYYHNYLLGEMLASQLRAAIERECGGFVAHEEAGRFLVDRVFRTGNLLRWDALIEEATGKGLSASDFGSELSG